MAFERKTFAPDTIEAARRLYEDMRAPLVEVAAALGITRRTLTARMIEWGWAPRLAGTKAKAGRRSRSARAPRSATAKVKRTRAGAKTANAAERKPRRQQTAASTHAEALALRVQRVVERELDAIDTILGAIGAADAAEAERSARTLASLARALKEVMRLAAPDETTADGESDDTVPRDLDEFRRELARRLEALGSGAADKASDRSE